VAASAGVLPVLATPRLVSAIEEKAKATRRRLKSIGSLASLSASRFDAAKGGNIGTVDHFKSAILIYTDQFARWRNK